MTYIQEVFSNVKRKNKRYKSILVEFQDALRMLASMSYEEKVLLHRRTENCYVQPSVDAVYEGLLAVARSVWREAFLLDERGKTKVDIQKNFIRFESLCVDCSLDMLAEISVHHEPVQESVHKVNEPGNDSDDEPDAESGNDSDDESDHESGNDSDHESVHEPDAESGNDSDDESVHEPDAESVDESDHESGNDESVNKLDHVSGEPDRESVHEPSSEESDYEEKVPRIIPTQQHIKVVTVNDKLIKQKQAVKMKLLQKSNDNSFF